MISGPVATMMLGDQGADVIKVEPPDGDLVRNLGPNRGGLDRAVRLVESQQTLAGARPENR